jgi:hypothetical protein
MGLALGMKRWGLPPAAPMSVARPKHLPLAVLLPATCLLRAADPLCPARSLTLRG